MPDSEAPRLWIKTFWGFEPDKDAYVGFTHERDRDRFLRRARPGDRVVIYGANTEQTPAGQKGIVLGFLEVDLSPIRDVQGMSPERTREKAANGWRERWTYAVPVTRAWKCLDPVKAKYLASESLSPGHVRTVASKGKLLTIEEARRFSQLRAQECSVYGKPPITGPIQNQPFLNTFKPSRGVTPTFGVRESVYEDGNHFLYILLLEGNPASILGRDPASVCPNAIMKIGFSNTPARRRDEHNATLPPNCAYRWELFGTSGPYEDGESAKIAEDRFKELLDAKMESLGGEFFLGRPIDAQRIMLDVPDSTRTIQAAPALRRA